MTLYDAQGRVLRPGKSVGQGGEATVYQVLDHPDRLAKIYDPAPRPNYAQKLAWMVSHPPANPTQDLHHASLAWPDGLIFDSRRQLKGFWMPFVQRAVPLLDVFNPRRRVAVLPQFDRRYLYRTARNLAAALSALHRSGYVAGDINESNVLVTPAALVTLIDTDSFQVTEAQGDQVIVHPCPVGKPEYTPPELQGRSLADVVRHPDHDAFGLAILIFQLLMEGSHPFRAQWLGAGDPPPLEVRIAQGAFPHAARPSMPVAPPKKALGLDTLHPWLGDLFRRCFIDGHSDPRYRPGPDLWVRAIAEAEQSLVCCAQGHYYASHLAECPYCTFPMAQRRQSATQANPAARTARGTGRTWWNPRPAKATPPPTAQPRGQPAAAQPRKPVQPAHPAASAQPGPAGRSATPGGPAQSARPTAAQPPPTGARTATPPPANPSPPSNRAATSGSPAAGPGTPARGSSRVSGASSWWSPSGPTGYSPPVNAWSWLFNGSQAWSTGGAASTSTASSPGGFSRGVGMPGTPGLGSINLRGWVRQRAYKSFVVGGAQGALAGALPGLLIGLLNWSSGDVLAWTLLFTLGGAAGGLLRGWTPGHRLAGLIDRYVGWKRFWEGLGLTVGAVTGTLFGLVFIWAIFPVILGLVLGAQTGKYLGQKLWQVGSRLGWERIWGGLSAVGAAALGFGVAKLAGALGMNALGAHLGDALLPFAMNGSATWALAWMAAGGLGSALAGALAGILADLFGRLFGLVN